MPPPPQHRGDEVTGELQRYGVEASSGKRNLSRMSAERGRTLQQQHVEVARDRGILRRVCARYGIEHTEQNQHRGGARRNCLRQLPQWHRPIPTIASQSGQLGARAGDGSGGVGGHPFRLRRADRYGDARNSPEAKGNGKTIAYGPAGSGTGTKASHVSDTTVATTKSTTTPVAARPRIRRASSSDAA